MRILFFSNAMPTFFSAIRPGPSYVTGGWITGMLDAFAQSREAAVSCCFPIPKDEPPFHAEHRGLFAYGVPMRGAFTLTPDPGAEAAFAAILGTFRPDVIHIWGTESAAALPLVAAIEKAGLSARTAIHIQGVVAAIARHYEAGLPQNAVNAWTLRDVLRHDNIACQKRAYEKRAENEALLLNAVGHAIGRTDFDRAECLAINPRLTYHRCNESLRPSFYRAEWSREESDRHTLFFSQGNYPLKGLHLLIEALPKLIFFDPALTVRVAGGDPTRAGEGLRGRLLIGGYGAYLKKRMDALNVTDRVRFLGTLDEAGMLREYLGAGAFISASANENSSNSVGEAMLLGVPLVSTEVGGVPSLVTNGEDGRLVPFGAPDALADAIEAVFREPAETDRLRKNARARARIAHDPVRNREALMGIYRGIAGDRK